jgi:hypothetical protein
MVEEYGLRVYIWQFSSSLQPSHTPINFATICIPATSVMMKLDAQLKCFQGED